MGNIAFGLIRHQQFNNHTARLFRPFVLSMNNHALGRFADTRGGQGALALNLDHASATVPIGAISGCRFVTQMRNNQTAAIGHFPNGHTTFGFDLLAIQLKTDSV